MSPPGRIFWRGDFLPEHSFARINRELSRAIVATGRYGVVAQGEPTLRVEDRLGIPARPVESYPAVEHTFTLQHAWPPRYRVPASGHTIHIQPFEFGTVLNEMAAATIRTVDDVWCPSTYVQRLYVEAGVPEERTFVLPWGVDPDVYRPDGDALDVGSASVFVFLFVGGLLMRKGLDRLLDAYLAEFARGDDVALIVKGFGGASFYPKGGLHQRVIDAARRGDTANVRFSDELLNDPTMAALYRRADAFVLPYRGEGFGLTVLEAMACGTPPIVTRGGATDDFVDDATGYRLPAQRVAIGETLEGHDLARPGWQLEVDGAALRRALRHAYEHRDELRAVGARAADAVRERFLWRHAGERAAGRLDALAGRAPLAREGCAEDAQAYALRPPAPLGEDGILTELFARLRFAEPSFVAIAADGGDVSPCGPLTARYGWSGSRFDPATPVAALAPELAARRTPIPLDLLVIAVAGGAAHWEAAARHRARVVVAALDRTGTAALAAVAARLDYALVAADHQANRAFFVRRELLAPTGFAERALDAVAAP